MNKPYPITPDAKAQERRAADLSGSKAEHAVPPVRPTIVGNAGNVIRGEVNPVHLDAEAFAAAYGAGWADRIALANAIARYLAAAPDQAKIDAQSAQKIEELSALLRAERDNVAREQHTVKRLETSCAKLLVDVGDLTEKLTNVPPVAPSVISGLNEAIAGLREERDREHDAHARASRILGELAAVVAPFARIEDTTLVHTLRRVVDEHTTLQQSLANARTQVDVLAEVMNEIAAVVEPWKKEGDASVAITVRRAIEPSKKFHGKALVAAGRIMFRGETQTLEDYARFKDAIAAYLVTARG